MVSSPLLYKPGVLHNNMLMRKNKTQAGFIPMLIILFLMIAAVIVFAFMRVLHTGR